MQEELPDVNVVDVLVKEGRQGRPENTRRAATSHLNPTQPNPRTRVVMDSGYGNIHVV